MIKYKKWTSEELDYISAKCKDIKDKDLAGEMSRVFGCLITLDMVRRQRRKLNIRKRRGRYKKDTYGAT